MKIVDLIEVVDGVTLKMACVLTDEQYQKIEVMSKEHPEMTTAELVDTVQKQKLTL